MKLNNVEKFLMNNPLRSLSQRYIESTILKHIGEKALNESVLEIGCGRGVGIDIILNKFNAQKIVAVDIDEDMLKLAKFHSKKFKNKSVKIENCSADNLPFPDNHFDSVFDFGIIHHIEDWQKSIKEISRVLKPSGKFYYEEVSKKALYSWPFRTFLEHPKENRFSCDEFHSRLLREGLNIKSPPVRLFFDWFFFGVAIKKEN